MTDEDGVVAHETSELFQELIVSTGVTLLKGLTPDQRDYVLSQAHNEFRFRRVEDALNEALP